MTDEIQEDLITVYRTPDGATHATRAETEAHLRKTKLTARIAEFLEGWPAEETPLDLLLAWEDFR